MTSSDFCIFSGIVSTTCYEVAVGDCCSKHLRQKEEIFNLPEPGYGMCGGIVMAHGVLKNCSRRGHHDGYCHAHYDDRESHWRIRANCPRVMDFTE